MADSRAARNRSAPKFTRCRTGCLRCRERRRKCDEGKPQCQNCIDKNLVCHYGLQVTFLPKNSFTVAADGLRRPRPDSTNYNNIQFVNETDSVATASAKGPPSPTFNIPSSPLSAPTVSNTLLRRNNPNRTGERLEDAQSGTPENEGADDLYRDAPSTLAPWALESHHQRDRSMASKRPFIENTFSDNDEFAVRGLLALGTGAGTVTVPAILDTTPGIEGMSPHMEPALAISTPQRAIGGTHSEVHTGFLDAIMGASTPIAAPSNLAPDAIGEIHKLKLLQHYRYHVAPWLDLYDLKHSFGVVALRMAVKSERLLTALLVLSETCMRKKHHHNIHSTGLGSSPNVAGAEFSAGQSSPSLHSNFTEDVLLKVFEELECLVSDIARTWAKSPNDNYGPLQSLVHTAYGLSIESASYWMFLRLDLGRALANNTPIQIPLPSISIPSLSLLCRTEDTHERVGHYAQVLLWLCGKASITYHQESIPQRPHQLTDSWLHIFEELTQWYYLRPQEFQPMVELNSEDSALNPRGQFPLLLFTNGAGALCNQLYHTAMILLLECKPRTALLDNPHPPVSSSLWHAQRVCGIAINNDNCDYWDPCLLASFLVAARRMTHGSQQQEIIKGFDRIQAITGWGVSEYLTQLREEWSFLEGVE